MCPNKETNLEEKVKSLYEIMQDEKVEEIDIKSADMKLFIRRKGSSKPQNFQHIISSESINAAQNNSIQSPQQQSDAASGDTVKSPITGVFYRSASPTSPMFVNEGDVVDTGKTLCIIEAMKVMNEIKATEKIKIVKILIENGKSVNSSQDLFVIEKL